jgi:DivIVA domain-containing protein
MDWNDVERLRAPGFAIARRGYDQREVDRFLEQLADWLETDAANEITELALKRKLELVGKSTSNILLTTQQEAEQLRHQTEEHCAELRHQTDEQCAELRARAEQEVAAAKQAADEEARLAVEEGERRRSAIEAIVGELELRRAETLKDLDRLSGELAATIERHMASERPARRNSGNAGQRTKESETPTIVG